VTLQAETESVFYIKEDDAQIRFDGTDKLVLVQAGRNMPGRRMK